MNRILNTFAIFLTVCIATQCTTEQNYEAQDFWAQSAREEIYANPLLAASNHLAYQIPTWELTPAPQGYTPFCITHYGRHGSRWLINDDEYSGPVATLMTADSLGKLSEYGRDVLTRLQKVEIASRGRLGELTPLGHRQHRGIAERMYYNFRPVFEDGTIVTARSSNVIRCILSMTSETQRLAELNPDLIIDTDASEADLYFTNTPLNWTAEAYSYRAGGRTAITQFNATHIHPERLMSVLFTDPEYMADQRQATSLMNRLWAIATNQQSLDMDFDFEDLFTIEEKYDLWQCQNVRWYQEYGPSSQTQGMMPYYQADLLRNMLDTADECIASGKTGASLRFGHEVVLLPLACLMELDKCGTVVDDMEALQDQWRNYYIYPMGCNIQLILYRKADDAPILVKALLNEREVTLPVETDSFPYYLWDKVESYYRNKIENHK